MLYSAFSHHEETTQALRPLVCIPASPRPELRRRAAFHLRQLCHIIHMPLLLVLAPQLLARPTAKPLGMSPQLSGEAGVPTQVVGEIGDAAVGDTQNYMCGSADMDDYFNSHCNGPARLPLLPLCRPTNCVAVRPLRHRLRRPCPRLGAPLTLRDVC